MAKRRKKAKKIVRKKKTNSLYVAMFTLAIIILIIAYYFIFVQKPQTYEQEQPTRTITPEEEIKAVTTGGICARNSECFISYCKGEVKDCINTTQLATYNKNCKTYADWVLETQNPSVCACMQNHCKMIK